MKTELERISGITLEKRDGKLHYSGYLDLRGTQITSLPENLTVGGYLDLERHADHLITGELDGRRLSRSGRHADH